MEESLIQLEERYKNFLDKKITLNMERGWPCKEQLDLSVPMLDVVNSRVDLCRENDYRGYAGTGGILPAKELFALLFEVTTEQIYMGETMSTTIMYDLMSRAMMFGFPGYPAWKTFDKVKFICPSPGYEKHFKICESFDIEMIPVSMNVDGPDMDAVEKLVMSDQMIKGMWCVPLYSNPTGSIYSDEVIERIAKMHTKAKDFKVFWDNAYCVHHLSDENIKIKNIIECCEKFGNADRVFEFASTSKITFPGAGIAMCISSKNNINWLTKSRLLQLKTGDKINQLRHVLFLKDLDGISKHMKRHQAIIKPKFDLVDSILHAELDGWEIASWIKPKGGYFINLELECGMAQKVWELCKAAGVSFTPAGSTFPYGIDQEDRFLRIAPTYPEKEELKMAVELLCIAIKLVYLREKDGIKGEESY